MIFRTFVTLAIVISLYSCSNKKDELAYQPQNQINAYDTYKEGLKAFEKNDFFLQVKNFQKPN